MNWIPLILLVAGVIAVCDGFRRDSHTSFHDGTFILEIIEILGGGAAVVIAWIWFAVLAFMAL